MKTLLLLSLAFCQTMAFAQPTTDCAETRACSTIEETAWAVDKPGTLQLTVIRKTWAWTKPTSIIAYEARVSGPFPTGFYVERAKPKDEIYLYLPYTAIHRDGSKTRCVTLDSCKDRTKKEWTDYVELGYPSTIPR